MPCSDGKILGKRDNHILFSVEAELVGDNILSHGFNHILIKHSFLHLHEIPCHNIRSKGTHNRVLRVQSISIVESGRSERVVLQIVLCDI